jgi:hypothetical protein
MRRLAVEHGYESLVTPACSSSFERNFNDDVLISFWGKTMKAAKRELIDTGTDKRYVRRAKDGTFKESDDVGKSLSQDKRKKAKTNVKSGQGDKGDRKK